MKNFIDNDMQRMVLNSIKPGHMLKEKIMSIAKQFPLFGILAGIALLVVGFNSYNFVVGSEKLSSLRN